jgi:hypothetical protein
MDMRVYDTETGVIIASENVAAEKVTSGRELGINLGDFRFDDQRSQSSTLGFVTRELIQKALEKIVADSAKVPWTARIIKVTSDTVYVNAGVEVGVAVGQRYRVISVGEKLRDPDTGEVLASEDKPVGEIEITRVDAKYSVGKIIEKKGAIKNTDKVLER